MQTVDWSKLVSLKYWLEGTVASETANLTTIEQNSFFFYFFVGSFSFLLVIAILLSLLKVFLHPKHPLQTRIPFLATNFFWMGFLGLGWFGLREIQVAFLGARFWLLFELVWFIAIIVWLARYWILFRPMEMRYFKEKVINSHIHGTKKIKE